MKRSPSSNVEILNSFNAELKMILIMYLNQSILQLYQTYKSLLGECLVWIIDSVVDQNIYISKNNPLAGNSYIKLPK